MFTRIQYMNKECTHREYYAQFVTEQISQRVKSMNGTESLHVWDRMPSLPKEVTDKIKEVKDGNTLSFKVCLYKEATRQKIEKENNENNGSN